MKINATLEQWAEALESGKYTQGPSLLKNKDTGNYCCLGVLAEIGGADSDDVLSYDWKLIDAIAEWVKENTTTMPDTFISWNDAIPPDPNHKTFPEIAAEIRKMIKWSASTNSQTTN